MKFATNTITVANLQQKYEVGGEKGALRRLGEGEGRGALRRKLCSFPQKVFCNRFLEEGVQFLNCRDAEKYELVVKGSFNMC